MIASGNFVELKGLTDKGLDATCVVATRADYAKALLPVTELVSYAHWAERWFRYMAAAALLKPEMLPNLAAHAAFIGVAATRFPDRLIQYDRAYRLNRSALMDDWKRAEALDPEFSISSLPDLAQVQASVPENGKPLLLPPNRRTLNRWTSNFAKTGAIQRSVKRSPAFADTSAGIARVITRGSVTRSLRTLNPKGQFFCIIHSFALLACRPGIGEPLISLALLCALTGSV